MSQSIKISVVVPVLNESDSIDQLYKKIIDNLKDLNYEIIFVNDGSTDSTEQIISDIIDKNITLISFASPRVGNKEWKNDFESKLLN